MSSTPRDAAAEANTILSSTGTSSRARVLEPSPPANTDPAWFADDPVQGAGTEDGLVVPAGMAAQGESDWSAWAGAHPEHATWVAERWLGGARSLGQPPTDLASTRVALHRLAAYVIAPARHKDNGKFGLRWTLGGFGTPFFGDNRQIRVADGELIDQRGDAVRTAAITTLAEAASFLETEIDPDTAAEHDSPELGDPHKSLPVTSAQADYLGSWFGMGFAALERVRADSGSVDPSRPQLWPGHFDPAIEVGDEDHRASYGASPGDHVIDEPYLYVSVWWPDRVGLDATDPAWNAPAFTGAVLRVSDFADGDPVDVAAAFWIATRDRLGR